MGPPGDGEMIIKRNTAKRLVRDGQASEVGICHHDEREYIIVDRYDLQRTDHYLATSADCERIRSRDAGA